MKIIVIVHVVRYLVDRSLARWLAGWLAGFSRALAENHGFHHCAAPMTATSFGKAIPVLALLNIPRTLAFYRDVLGFQTHHVEGHSYRMAVRGGTELHFWACSDPHIAQNTSCYLRVDNIAAVY